MKNKANKPRSNDIVLAGLTRKQLRDYLNSRNRHGGGHSSIGDVSAFFENKLPDFTEQRAEAIQAALIAEGYVESEPPHEFTQQGRQASGKLMIKRLTRTEANTVVAEMIERAKAFNADGSEPYFIHSIHAFGSYANEAADSLGDIDVVAILAKRADIANILHGNVPTQDLLKFHEDRGLGHVNAILRASNPYLSMHSAQSVIEHLRVPLRRIFDAADHPLRSEPTQEQTEARAVKALRRFTATVLRLLARGSQDFDDVKEQIRTLAEAWEDYYAYPFAPAAYMLDIERDRANVSEYEDELRVAEEEMQRAALRLLGAELDGSKLHINKNRKALAKARDYYIDGVVAKDRDRCKRVPKTWPYDERGFDYRRTKDGSDGL